jgi:GNAT superfamily N-acetyltransferase
VAKDSFVIRAAEAGDVPRILAFINELAEYERLAHTVIATEESLRETLFGACRAAEVLLAELGGEPVGFALFFTNYSTFMGRPGIYLEDLYVRPAARGNGAGKALFLQVAKLAAQRQCGRLEWAVLDWNQPSIQFYKSMGAQAMSEWTTYRLTAEDLAALVK